MGKEKMLLSRTGAGMTEPINPEHLQAIAAREQLWTSLQTLLPEIQLVADGQFSGSDRERLIAQVLARIVIAELQFRNEDPG